MSDIKIPSWTLPIAAGILPAAFAWGTMQEQAEATAEAITKVAKALNQKGGEQAANLEVAKQYVKEFGNIAKENNTLIIPSDVNNVSSVVATAMSVIEKTKKK